MGSGRILKRFMEGLTVALTLKAGLDLVRSPFSKEPSNSELSDKMDKLSQHTAAKIDEQTSKLTDVVEKHCKSTNGSGAGPA